MFEGFRCFLFFVYIQVFGHERCRRKALASFVAEKENGEDTKKVASRYAQSAPPFPFIILNPCVEDGLMEPRPGGLLH